LAAGYAETVATGSDPIGRRARDPVGRRASDPIGCLHRDPLTRPLPSQIIGGYAGASLGIGLGIWFVGNYYRKDVRASLPVTLLGTTLGAGFGLLAAVAAGGPGAIAALFTPIAGGLIGYRATRHWRSKRSLLPAVSSSNAQGVRVTTLSVGAQW
jgi:hypothetical protein